MRYSSLIRLPQLPLILLILANLILGGLTFQDYGVSWDEPEFYAYAAAAPYAYSLPERLSGNFQLDKSFGPAPERLKTYGPAYLLVARPLAGLFVWSLRVSWYAAWHLVNFLTFQAGLFFFYLLCRRWLSTWGSFAATLLLASQPLLWGHAFFNPKDIPFLSLFIATMVVGYHTIDRLGKSLTGLRWNARQTIRVLAIVLPAGILLGFLAATRIPGPLAGILIVLFGLTRFGRKIIPGIVAMAIIALMVLYITWPYLWSNPLATYLSVVLYMSDNPWVVPVLFQRVFYGSNQLPASYLPVMVSINLTEPVWLIFFPGLAVVVRVLIKREADWRSLVPVLSWFFLPFFYVITFRPALYDGLRHLLFILPPIFLVGGFALEQLFKWVSKSWLKICFIIALAVPGILGGVRLHPFEYTYYNFLAGGTGGAFRRFETDYWLTCYKQAIEAISRRKPEGARVYVFRETDLAGLYATETTKIEPMKPFDEQPPPGSLMLFTTRVNDDLKLHPDDPFYLSIGKEGAVFCVIRQMK